MPKITKLSKLVKVMLRNTVAAFFPDTVQITLIFLVVPPLGSVAR